MRFLLDTCVFLWFIARDKTLPSFLVEKIRSPENEVFLSAISMWEISVKQKLGKITLPEDAGAYIPEQRRQHQIESLALDEESVAHLKRLPELHRDPFDRILICQALEKSLTLMTPDEVIRQYPIKTLWE